MIEGTPLSELAQQLITERQTQRDFIADTHRLTTHPAGAGVSIELQHNDGTMDVTPTRFALGQIANHYKIPMAYVDRMIQANAGPLLAQNLAYWFAEQPSTRLLRTRTGDTGELRAFLSRRYRALDNYELAEAVIPQLERPGVRVVSARITDTHFYLQATSDRVTAEVRRGDIVQAAVVIANSEVGASSLRVSPMVYRLVCTNGLISGSELRQHHVGRGLDPNDGASEFYRDETCRAVDRAFWLKVVDTVDAAMNEALFGQLVDKLRVAAGEPLDAKPSAIVEVVGRRFGLTETEQDGVLQQLALGADWTRYGVVNAVTRIAEDSATYDRAVELERIGGEVLDLPVSAFSHN
jgi:Domain of unknown function (DUF932)